MQDSQIVPAYSYKLGEGGRVKEHLCYIVNHLVKEPTKGLLRLLYLVLFNSYFI